jgi:hypothetical protein
VEAQLQAHTLPLLKSGAPHGAQNGVKKKKQQLHRAHATTSQRTAIESAQQTGFGDCQKPLLQKGTKRTLSVSTLTAKNRQNW